MKTVITCLILSLVLWYGIISLTTYVRDNSCTIHNDRIEMYNRLNDRLMKGDE